MVILMYCYCYINYSDTVTYHILFLNKKQNKEFIAEQNRTEQILFHVNYKVSCDIT